MLHTAPPIPPPSLRRFEGPRPHGPALVAPRLVCDDGACVVAGWMPTSAPPARPASRRGRRRRLSGGSTRRAVE